MSKIEWEYDLAERPFCEQLRAMGWQWIEGDVQVPEFTERQNFREVLLRGRLGAALRKLNLRDEQPWLDDARIAKIIGQLEATGGMRLMEVNQELTGLLLKGAVADGLPDWNHGRPQPVKFIDFENPENNDFLVVNQFKVALTSGTGHVIPDAVLFVNGIPLAVAEFKSPGIEGPMHAAIDQILRYTNQRKELYPTQYSENEGVERLFHTNQLLIASDFFEARAATVGAPPDAWLEWADHSPATAEQVAQEVGKTTLPGQELGEAQATLRTMGREQGDRTGTPLFFREAQPAVPAATPKLTSQQILVAGMLRPAHFLDLIRNFTVFQQSDGRTRKVVARYQQFRAIHKAVARLESGRNRAEGAQQDGRGGVIWHTQGSGKSLSMVFLVRKMRMNEKLKRYKIVVVTDRTDLQDQLGATAQLSGEAVRPTEADLRSTEAATARTQRLLSESTPDIVMAMLQKYQTNDVEAPQVEMTITRQERVAGRDGEIREQEVTFRDTIRFEEFPVLNDSPEILVLVDEAHRSHTRSLHRNLHKALPNAAIIGFTGTPILSCDKTQTQDIFGQFIDKYRLQDAELDGATVPILYEGRTADGAIKDADDLDALFADMFRGYSDDELAAIKARYAAPGDILEAPLLIEQKAKDMLKHFVSVVMPEGYKAQVVATSRQAVMTYLEKFAKARDELVAQVEALCAAKLGLGEEALLAEDAQTRFLIRLHPQLPMLKAMEFAAAFSGNHNDPENWKPWADKENQKNLVTRFKRRMAPEKTAKTDPLSVLVVMNMLLTGFDAPVEQVLYLDRKIVAHDLLQAIARVNRTYGKKKCGYVVDYIGVARHLKEALGGYDQADTADVWMDMAAELPKLLDRRNAAVAVFTGRGIQDLQTQVEACVYLLEDLEIRADFINKLRAFYDLLGVMEHRAEIPGEIFRDAKLLGFINKVAANLYRDPTLTLLGVAEKVKELINTHISARGIDPKIPPTVITDAQFEQVLQGRVGARARAAEMQHAARYHIVGFEGKNPAFARKMSERLQEILNRLKDDWDALERELRRFIEELKQGDHHDFPDLDPRAQVPFIRLTLEAAGENLSAEKRQGVIEKTMVMVKRIQASVRRVGFWRNDAQREQLTRELVRDLDAAGIHPPTGGRELAQRLVALARENHEDLARE